jgi:hypothetical protein
MDCENSFVRDKVESALELMGSSLSLDTIAHVTGLDVSFIVKLNKYPDIGLEDAVTLYYLWQNKREARQMSKSFMERL